MNVSRHHTDGILSNSGIRLIENRQGAARDLLAHPPGTTFERSEVATNLAAEFKRFRIAGIIRIAAKRSSTHGNHLWEVHPDAYERAQKRSGADTAGPCPHGGVVNLREEDGYTCRNDDCDIRFDRGTAKRILSNTSP